VSLLTFYLWEYVLEKYVAYTSRELDQLETLKLIAFMLGSLYYSTNRASTAVLFAPLLVISLLISSGRVVILGYFVFSYMACKSGPRGRMVLLLVNFYFLLKGVFFLVNLFQRGSGFADA
jgi:hypothetical protein